MKSSIRTDSFESSFIQILKGIFKVESTNSIKTANKKGKKNEIKRNELDYFEYTYFSDSPY